MAIVELDKLTVRYGLLKAVDGVSLQINEGSSFAIVGESGCGKTTLAKVMTGLVKPNQGTIQVKAPVQMVFQDPNNSLDPLMTIDRILAESFYRMPKVPFDDRTQQINEMLVAVGLSASILGRYPHEFSGGQRQRIAIARALLAKPKVLVFDEVTSSLDVLVQRQILDLLIELKPKFRLTYIFISHNLRAVKSFADTICVMKRGKIVESGTTSDILTHPKEAYSRQLVSAALTYRADHD